MRLAIRCTLDGALYGGWLNASRPRSPRWVPEGEPCCWFTSRKAADAALVAILNFTDLEGHPRYPAELVQLEERGYRVRGAPEVGARSIG